MSVRPRPISEDANVSQHKRARLLGDSTEIHRSSSFYFDDGNIVLFSAARKVKGKKKKVVAYRVHRSVLSRQSSVFADMFALPSGPQPDAEQYDGVPSVFLPDGVADVTAMLEALYDAHRLPYHRGDSFSALQLEEVLRMSKKYMIDEIFQRVVSHLENDWPGTLYQWDMNEAAIKVLAKYKTVDGHYDDEYLDDAVPEPASAIRLARDNELAQILPSALYQLSRIPFANDFYEVRDAEDLCPLLEGARTARRSLLGRDDLKSLLIGKEHIDDFIKRELCPKSFCKETEPVKSTCDSVAFDFWNNLKTEALRSRDPLTDLGKYRENANTPTDMCYMCTYRLQARLKDIRLEFWERLPEIFELDVPGWKENCD